MSDSAEQLRKSYADCRRVARRAHSNFTPCFYLLSPERRTAMQSLYAFMRHTDDLADGEPETTKAAEALEHWRARTTEALTGAVGDLDGQSRILPAVADTVSRFEIPHDYLFDAIDGVEMDLTRHRYETFDELSQYCYRVATVVGLACLRIWGYRGDDPAEAAHACGRAFQLTNILRDLREDHGRGRVYLPQQELERFGCNAEGLLESDRDRFCDMMRFQTERAERYFREATRLADGLQGDGRRIFLMMIRVYYRLLKVIEADPLRVLSRRVCLGRWRPLAIMGRTLLQPSAKAVLP